MKSWLRLGIIGVVGCSDGLDPDAPAWSALSTDGVPARWGHVAVYDAARDRMLVFGGEGSDGQRSDLWALDLASRSWSPVDAAPGPAPSPRTDLAGILDAPRDRLVLIGGRVGMATSIAEVWALDLASRQWSPLAAGPSARHDVSAATDGQRAWVFGGAGVLFQSLDDLWELDLATDTWRLLPDGGARPSARTSGAFVHDRGALYLYGGHDVSQVQRDGWRYDLAAGRWARLTPTGGSVAGAHFGVALDAACDTLLLSAGDNLDNYDTALTDGLVLGASPRFARLPTSVLPPPRDHATLVLDPSRRQLILYGGGSLGDGLGLRSDAWWYPLGRCL